MEFSGNSNIGTLVQKRERGRVRENASESVCVCVWVRERERKRLLVSVKSKQKKFEVAFGERERSSLFAFARTRLLAKRAIRVIRLSGKLYGREGKKNRRKKKKLILAPHAHAARIFPVEVEGGERGEKGSRDCSTASGWRGGEGRLRDKTSGKSKIKGGEKVKHVILDTNFCATTRNGVARRHGRGGDLLLVYALRDFNRPRFSFRREIRKARILFTI